MTSIDGYSRIDEVATLLVEVIEHVKSSLLAALTHYALPSVAKVHGTQAYWTDVHGGRRSKYPMASQQALWWSRRWSSHCNVVYTIAVLDERRVEKRRKETRWFLKGNRERN